MAEIILELQRKPCDWCVNMSGPAAATLYVGPGIFRDLDSDHSYGIPVCSGCGGIGSIVAGGDFKARVKRISGLRFKYCPMDNLPELPAILCHNFLKELIREIIELY